MIDKKNKPSDVNTANMVSPSNEPKNLLDAIRTVLESAKSSALSDDFYENVSVPMTYLTRRLDLTPSQVTLLSVILEIGFNRCVNLGNIARFLDTSNLEILEKSTDLTTLQTRRRRFVPPPHLHSLIIQNIAKKRPFIFDCLTRILFIFLQAAATHNPLSAVAPAQIRRGCVKKCPKCHPRASYAVTLSQTIVLHFTYYLLSLSQKKKRPSI